MIYFDDVEPMKLEKKKEKRVKIFYLDKWEEKKKQLTIQERMDFIKKRKFPKVCKQPRTKELTPRQKI